MNESLPSLDRLEAEFARVARRRRTWFGARPRTLLLAAGAALLISAAALAASGALTGEPVKNLPGTPAPRPHVADGVVIQRSVKLTDLRVSDPGGGPPWGLRTFTTTRARGCVQVGRIVDGRLGVLGQDGAFADDERFHEVTPGIQRARFCAPLDGAGVLFIALSVQGATASAQMAGCVIRRSTHIPANEPNCPSKDVRVLLYGTVGPDASAVTYRDRGRTHTLPTAGPWGAYLVVLRPSRLHPARGGYGIGSAPVSGLRSISYRDGHICRIGDPRRLGGGRACRRVGMTAPPATTPSAARLRAPVHVTVSTAVHAGGSPAEPALRAVRLSFRARVTAGPRSLYFIRQRLTPGSRCPHGGAMSIAPIARDVRAGQVVTRTIYIPAACRGGVTGEVRFQPATTDNSPLGFPADPFHAPLVGRFTAPLPRR